MKTRVKILLLNLSILITGLLVFSCEKEITPSLPTDANARAAAQGRAVFWTASKTLGGAYIEVFIGGKSMGRVTSYQSTAPACGASGFVTVTAEAGTYTFTATGQDGAKFSGSVKIVAGQCATLEFKGTGATTEPVLTPKGGNVTFWTSQAVGWSSINVWVDNVFQGTINKTYYTSTPACKAAGTVYTTISAGTHTYKAQSDKGHTWNGNVTVQDGQCYPLRLDFPPGTGTTTGGTNTPTQVVFWTKSTQYGTISVYLNNNYMGTITKAYGSAPSCGTSGCVTATITATNNTWYAKNSAGRQWTGTYTLKPGCTTLVLN